MKSVNTFVSVESNGIIIVSYVEATEKLKNRKKRMIASGASSNVWKKCLQPRRDTAFCISLFPRSLQL
jgi:hypothetical protein